MNFWTRINKIYTGEVSEKQPGLYEKIDTLYWYADYHGLESIGTSCKCNDQKHARIFPQMYEELDRLEREVR